MWGECEFSTGALVHMTAFQCRIKNLMGGRGRFVHSIILVEQVSF